MAFKKLQLYFGVFFMLTNSILATDLLCPTITKTTHHPACPAPTPSFCPTPLCIIESQIQVPCNCPTEMPTSMLYTACPTKCEEGCGTYFNPILAPCTPTSAPSITISVPSITISVPTTTTFSTITTTQPSTCSTITVSAGPDCWTDGCETTYSRCQTTSLVTLNCGCKSIPTVTSCAKKCDGGCVTNWQTGYLPCPMTTPLPVPTGIY